MMMLFQILPTQTAILTAHAHLALLGFVSATIMGTMYQQVPTLGSIDLYSRNLGEISFWLLNLGLLGFAASLPYYGFELIPLIFALLLLLAVYAFCANILVTLRNSKAWTFALWFYTFSVVYLAIASTVGVIIFLGRMDIIELWRLLPSGSKIVTSHAHIAVLGWVSVIIIGAMSWMLPMVVMKDIYSNRLMKYVFYLVNIGIVGFFIGLINEGFGYLSLISALFIVAGGFLFVYIMLRTILGETKMKTKIVSTEAKFFESALVYFILVIIIGIAMLVNQDYIKNLSFGHVHLAMLGWISLTIFGGMYHVIPMLAWAGMTEKGVQPLPSTFKELYSEKLSWIIFWLANAGIIGLFIGSLVSQILTRLSSIIFTFSALIFAYEMLSIARKGI
jgi:cbb3-type cytochrome oxidase subunit 1